MEEENKNIEEPTVETPVEQTPAVEPTPEVAPVEEMPTPIEPEADPAPVVQEEPKVMESAVVPEKKKGKGGLIFLLLLLVIGGGFAAWYFAFGGKDVLAGKKEEPKQEEKKEESKEEEKKEESKEETKEEETTEKNNLQFVKYDEPYENIKYGEKTVTIEFKPLEDSNFKELYISGKDTGIKTGGFNNLNYLYQLGDKLVLVFNGTDIVFNFKVFDVDGNFIKNIDSLGVADMKPIYAKLSNEGFLVKDGYVEVTGSKFLHGDLLINGTRVDYCKDTSLSDNTLVSATYKLTNDLKVEVIEGTEHYLKESRDSNCK